MILRTSLFAALALGSVPVAAVEAAKIKAQECPYAEDSAPDGYTVACSRLTWTDTDIEFAATLAVFTPEDAKGVALPVIYIPGGPGDAPVTKDGDMGSVVTLFPGHKVITMNPRGVETSSPRPGCVFTETFWIEETEIEDELALVTTCRETVERLGVPMHIYDAPYLATDIDRMVRALKLEKAGIFGVSFGTESVLHLLADPPDWLVFAIMDSVSLPGVIGLSERMAARDRFLGVVDRLCFEQGGCPEKLREQYPNLIAWTKQFDDTPVTFKIGPNDAEWSLDGMEMLEFISSLASYPDGAGYGPVFIEAFEDARADTEAWIGTEQQSQFEYAEKNFALLYDAFSDGADRLAPPPEADSTKYPFDPDDFEDYAKLFRAWNAADREEPAFVTPTSEPEPVSVPVLMLSGGTDSLTPVEWAYRLKHRFSGVTHFVFPDLAHAVAFGYTDDVNNMGVKAQLLCGPRVVKAFVADAPFGLCQAYLKEGTDE